MTPLQITAICLAAIVLQASTRQVFIPWLISTIQHSHEAKRPTLVGLLGLLEFVQTASFIILLSIAIAVVLTLTSVLVSAQVATPVAPFDLNDLAPAMIGGLDRLGDPLSGYFFGGLAALASVLAVVAYLQRKKRFVALTQAARGKLVEELTHAAAIGELPPCAPNKEMERIAELVRDLDAVIHTEWSVQSAEGKPESEIAALESVRDVLVERFIDEDLKRRISNIKIEPDEFLGSARSNDPLIGYLSFIANKRLLGAFHGASFVAFLGAIYLFFGASIVAFSKTLHQPDLAFEIGSKDAIIGATQYEGAPANELNAERSVRAVVRTERGENKETQKTAEIERRHSEIEARRAAIAARLRLVQEARRAAETERQRKAEEARRAAEAERQRKAEEARRAAEAERQRKANEARRAAEAERQRKADEARRAAEAERQRKAEEARRTAEAERQRKAEEAHRAAEAERQRKADPPCVGVRPRQKLAAPLKPNVS